MATYSWNCATVDAYPTYESDTDVVYNVHWNLSASEDVDGTLYSASVYGTQALSVEDITDFVPFADLTNGIVTGWVEAAMGEEAVDALKASLDANIASQINPSSVTLTIGQ
jgi:hypothetical protein